jgi:hypothetical protein
LRAGAFFAAGFLPRATGAFFVLLFAFEELVFFFSAMCGVPP